MPPYFIIIVLFQILALLAIPPSSHGQTATSPSFLLPRACGVVPRPRDPLPFLPFTFPTFPLSLHVRMAG
jgi:hypothetical protein